MITAVFHESDTARASGLWQYDYGQVLRIQGLSLPTAVEIDFSLQASGGESEPQIGLTKDGVTDVMIPNSMLKNDGCIYDYNIYAFIYITDESSGKTIKKIIMRVRSRPKHCDEKIDTPEDRKLFREAIETVNKSAMEAQNAEKSAEAWAHGHEDYPERAEDNAKYYAEKAKVLASGITKQVEEGIKSIDTKTEESMSAINKAWEDWKTFLDSPVIDGGTFLDWSDE